jgi:hypothetical protein
MSSRDNLTMGPAMRAPHAPYACSPPRAPATGKHLAPRSRQLQWNAQRHKNVVRSSR